MLTLEYRLSLNSNLVVVPRSFIYNQDLSGIGKGLSWKTKYGFVGVDETGIGLIVDGINKKGLNAGEFYFKYDDNKANKVNGGQAITQYQVVAWILSWFATVEQTKKKLPEYEIK